MIGTEVDKKSIEYAKKCVRENNLKNLIKITVNSNDRIFKGVVEKDETYDFSMCNPPFFEIEDNSEKIVKTLPPRNAPSGNDGELKTKGGEIAFVMRMIEESIELKDQIKIYSTMIGRKADLIQLEKLIMSRNIENLTWTEFCQGHTTRWGLAWSFLSKNVMDLTAAPVIRKAGKSMVQASKKDYKITITFPAENKFSCMDNLINFLIATAEELNIKLQEVPVSKDIFDGWICRVTAEEKVWEHARRKRRLAQQLALKKLRGENNECIKTSLSTEKTSNLVRAIEKIDNTRETSDVPANEILSTVKGNGEISDKKMLEKRVPLLTCTLWVKIESSDDEESIVQDAICRISMIFENGSGGLEALQSLRQYLINRLDVKEKVLHDPLQRQSKRRKKKGKK